MVNVIFNSLYGRVNGNSLSWNARGKMSTEQTKHLIYGEISFDSLQQIYSFPKIQKYLETNKNFCDLGSGTGRIVIATALMYANFNQYCGIELLKDLYDKSNEILNNFIKIKKDFATRIKFINNDFFNIDLSNYDIIFMHYPMKNAEELYLQLESKMKKELRSNSLIISAIRKLRDLNTFPFIDKQTIQADYGDTTIYYHTKL